VDERCGLMAEPVLLLDHQVRGPHAQQRLPAERVEDSPLIRIDEDATSDPDPPASSYEVGDLPIEEAELRGLPGGDEAVLVGHHPEYPRIHELTLDRGRTAVFRPGSACGHVRREVGRWTGVGPALPACNALLSSPGLPRGGAREQITERYSRVRRGAAGQLVQAVQSAAYSPFWATSSSWEPSSTMTPSMTTAIRSASWAVWRR
jgi:hypothetical protein